MKYLVKFFVIILITFCTISSAEEGLSIVYINMEKVMKESIAGKSLMQQLEKIHKANIVEFKTVEEKLKEEESSILSQKNILSKEEFDKKVNLLKNKINDYKSTRKKKIDFVSKKKIDATAKLLEVVNPVLTDYSVENDISIILRKKDIVIAKSSLDITTEIIKIVNSKVKEINLK